MALIKYTIKENNTLGTHSFYAQAVTYSTLSVEDVAEEVCEGTPNDPTTVAGIINRYAKVVVRELQRGHRVKFGDVATFYPQISASVKDTLDEKGNVVKAATADMLNVALGKSTIGATITQAVQQQFAKSVSWKKVGDDDESAKATDGGDGGTTGGTTSGDGTGGNGTSGSSDSGSTSGSASSSGASGSASSSGASGSASSSGSTSSEGREG